jgi:hypothetical protein
MLQLKEIKNELYLNRVELKFKRRRNDLHASCFSDRNIKLAQKPDVCWNGVIGRADVAEAGSLWSMAVQADTHSDLLPAVVWYRPLF